MDSMLTHPFSPENPDDRSEAQLADDGKCFEVTIKVIGASRVNRLLSWIVRSQAYDDVTSLAVAECSDEEVQGPECA